MSIIQTIRERAAWLVFGLIALSLIGFLLMDAFVGKSRLFGNRSTTVGSINGNKIEYSDFQKAVSDQEEQYKQRNYPLNEAMQQNMRDNIWKQMIEDAVLSDNYTALDLNVSEKELNDMLVGPNAIPDIKQAFTDQKTGFFNSQAAAEQINQLRNVYNSGKRTDKLYDGARHFFEESVPQIRKMRQREKYLSLLANSVYVPKWMIEKGNADNSQIATISYVNTPYFTIPDSSVKVTDEDISEFVSARKDQFQQQDSRSIAYVVFDAAPTSADTAKIYQQLEGFRKDFAVADKPESFLARVGSEQSYSDAFLGKSKIMVPNKDSIFALQKGQLFGPYLDAGNYTVAKKIDEKTLPDSVRARHILIAMVNPQNQPILDDSSAKKRIDSIKNLIDKGARFDSLAAKISDDPGSKEKGGDLGYFTKDRMVKEFDEFAFNGKKGDKKIIKSQFGYHYVEILDQKNFEPYYKVAYLSRKIETSTETDVAASGLANSFAGESRDAKAFEQNIQKKGLQKLLALEIGPSAFSIPGLGANRQLVRWIYDAAIGDVSEPFAVGDKYVVAMLTEINAEGTVSTAKARPLVEPLLRNRKKADIIIKKLGTPASLEAASATAGQPVQHADSIMFSKPTIPNAGQEPKVTGSSFNKQLTGKPVSSPIPGNGGVFVIKVENTAAMANPNADVEQQRFSQEQQEKSMVSYRAIEVLKKNAKIKDDRGKFF
ncbi:MAG TPA: peptidylprolyl isomerase [Puia sp.]|nr:peptidylprolyl isomerase [Puia sp.]